MTHPTRAEHTVVWWRLPIVWMVLVGPAAVVVAGIATLAIAIRYPDPVLTAPAAHSSADVPAVRGRNHAASPLGRAQPVTSTPAPVPASPAAPPTTPKRPWERQP